MFTVKPQRSVTTPDRAQRPIVIWGNDSNLHGVGGGVAGSGSTVWFRLYRNRSRCQPLITSGLVFWSRGHTHTAKRAQQGCE